MVAGDIRNNLCNYFNHCNNCWQLLVLWQDKQANGCPTKLYCLLKNSTCLQIWFYSDFSVNLTIGNFCKSMPCWLTYRIAHFIRYSPTLAEIMLTTPFSECVVLVHLSGQWHHKSHTQAPCPEPTQRAGGLQARISNFRQIFFTLLDWPCKKGWDACGANGVMDRMAWQVKVEALLKVVHSVTHAVPKVDRRKMLRRTGECDVCTANGVGCLGQVLWSKAPQR